MDAKKTSLGTDAILPCLELERRLRGHRDLNSIERVGRIQNAFPGCLEFVRRRRLRSGGEGRGPNRCGGKLAAGQLHLLVIPIECFERGLLHHGPGRAFTGPEFKLSYGLFDEHFEPGNHSLALLAGVF